MTLLLRADSTTGRDQGGVAARRAVLRWARRLFRREWRQQVVVLALLTVTVAAAVGFATAANGAVAGTVAALLGTVVGVAGWLAAAPRLEEAVGYRVDAFNVPWWLIVACALLAIVSAAGAAWWPARTMARIPPVMALSGRPPRPSPVRRSAALAGVFIGAGLACLTVAGDAIDTTGDASIELRDTVLLAAGTIATVIGVLLISPLAIRLVAKAATGLPVAMRLALRDLGRFQARSGAALAAISLALGIPVAIVVTAAAAQDTAATGNLSDRQLIVQATQDEGAQAAVDRIANSLDSATVTPMTVAVDPLLANESGGTAELVPVEVGEPTGDGWRWVSPLYVATPQLLAHYGVDLDSIDPNTEFLTDETVELSIIRPDTDPGPGRPDSDPLANVEHLPPPTPRFPERSSPPPRCGNAVGRRRHPGPGSWRPASP